MMALLLLSTQWVSRLYAKYTKLGCSSLCLTTMISQCASANRCPNLARQGESRSNDGSL